MNNVLEKGVLAAPNPFILFPPLARDYFKDKAEGNYSEAKWELDKLLSFFPGDGFWASQKAEFSKMVKAK